MTYSLLSLLPWLVISSLIGALNITSAVILLKERHLGAWLMLGGGMVSLLGQIWLFVIQITMMIGSPDPRRFQLITVISSVCYLGGLLFSVGLLLHALYQKSKANRVSELEAIIASIRNQ